jgi:hypothetical protein
MCALGALFLPTSHFAVGASVSCQLGQLAPLRATLIVCEDINSVAFCVCVYIYIYIDDLNDYVITHQTDTWR